MLMMNVVVSMFLHVGGKLSGCTLQSTSALLEQLFVSRFKLVFIHKKDDQLIGCEHDCRVRDLTDQLGTKSAIHPGAAFLLPHQAERLPKLAILVTLLPKTCPDNLYSGQS